MPGMFGSGWFAYLERHTVKHFSSLVSINDDARFLFGKTTRIQVHTEPLRVDFPKVFPTFGRRPVGRSGRASVAGAEGEGRPEERRQHQQPDQALSEVPPPDHGSHLRTSHPSPGPVDAATHDSSPASALVSHAGRRSADHRPRLHHGSDTRGVTTKKVTVRQTTWWHSLSEVDCSTR